MDRNRRRGGPPVLPPWHWKFSVLPSRNVHTIVRSYGTGISFSVRVCPSESRPVGISHKTAKNLCERDALPTELYPRNRRKIITSIAIFIKHCPPIWNRLRPQRKILVSMNFSDTIGQRRS